MPGADGMPLRRTVDAKELEVLIKFGRALENDVESPQEFRESQIHWEACFYRGLNMELERTKTRTRNEIRRFKTVPLSMGAPHRGHDDPLIDTLRTDDDLIRAARAGDHDAFAELCRRHTQTARQRILAIVRHQEDAEDAMQETLFRAYTNLGRFRQSCKFSTWITAIGINAALSVIRKRKSRRESDTEPYSPDGVAWNITDRAPDPERRLAKAQIILLLRKEIHSLSPKMLEVVTSYYGNDYSLQEAADALGLSVAAVKSRLLRGRRILKSSLERKGLLNSTT
jgi:RNA polymerase sigma-70 factor, ECF subfamily